MPRWRPPTGWPADLEDEEILARLFELNQARADRADGAAA